jgi:hypothetical protein
MSGIAAYKAKVTIGANKIAGMGSWKLSGIEADQLEDSEFDDTWKTYKFGQKDGGTISVNGFYKKDDTTGQDIIRQANLENSSIATIRFYIDGTSYYTPCQTTGYFSPSVTSGAATVLSNVDITAYEVGAEKAGMVEFSFTAKVSGCLVLV